MATIKSSTEHLTLNADGASKDIKFQANGVEKASISSAGAFTSTSIDATKLTGALPAIDGSALTGVSQTTSAVNTAGQNWSGVAYTDPDAVGANPTAKIYPDGTVVGSTTNGSYIKYPNGTFETTFSSYIIDVDTTISISAGLYRSAEYTTTHPLLSVGTHRSTVMGGWDGLAGGQWIIPTRLSSAGLTKWKLVSDSSYTSGNDAITYVVRSYGTWK